MSSAAPTRTERRKLETRDRLLAAALEAFLERGFDAVTTGEVASRADVAAGTFYVHFQDKRDVFEALARRAAGEMIARWRQHFRRGLPIAELVATALEVAAEYWAESPPRARLFLEGPSFGSHAHVKLVEHLAEVVEGEVGGVGPGTPSAEVLASYCIGLAIELGRLIAGGEPEAARRTAAAMITFARRSFPG